MSVKFRVMQPFNFQTYSYVIVFNTSGDGNTPRANGTQTNYAGYSFAIIVGGTTGTGTATANLYQYYRPPNVTVPQLVPLQPTSNLFIFYPNTNGQGTEFTVTFARSLFYGINNTPGPTSTASATPSPSPSPSVSPSGSPSASPSSSPTALPSGAPAQIWHFNYFVASGTVGGQNLLPVDSLGAIPTGANDTTYVSPELDTSTQFDIQIIPNTGSHPSDMGPDNIAGGEIANNP